MSTDNQSKVGSKYRKLSPSAKRSIIASRKKRGDNRIVSYHTDYSETYVSGVLKGRFEHERILNFAYNMVRGRKAKS